MKYIASCSGGKDSIATVILAHEHNEPLDMIIFAEVMFDENISGELPEHIEFIKNKAFPLFESWGYKTKILHADKTYMDCFNRVIVKPRKNQKNKGKRKGFVMSGHCDVQRDCKLKPIKNFYSGINVSDIVQYIGIAIDEPERLARIRISDVPKISLLEKYGYIEQMAFDLCKRYDLLSPIYDFAPRGGCWFCPNARKGELRYLYNNHRDLFDKLVELEKEPNLIGYCWNTLTKTKITDIGKNFRLQDCQMTVFDWLKEE